MADQNYEKYWATTLEYSDIFGDRFNTSLRLILDFMDQNADTPYSKEKYERLQALVVSVFPKSEISNRKSINQFVKLGFVNPYLGSYHPEARAFLEEKNQTKKQSIFSKIVYSNSSFKRSTDTPSSAREINFFLKTLTEVGSLDKDDVIALMNTDTETVSAGFYTRNELEVVKASIDLRGFEKRKYNQLSHLRLILRKLDDIVVQKDYHVYLAETAPEEVIILDKPGKRDSYLQRIYKNELCEESVEKLGSVKCMVEKLEHPALVASHIKPYIDCSLEEAFDAENGLLLSRNMDALFDQGHLSFEDDGRVILSNKLSEELRMNLKSYALDGMFLSEKRKAYLKYHRENVFR
jgi:putative restriction endonuclease